MFYERKPVIPSYILRGRARKNKENLVVEEPIMQNSLNISNIKEMELKPEIKLSISIDFDTMTKAQLIEYADINNIDITKANTKSEILSIIKGE